jgi:hypothetical protein
MHLRQEFILHVCALQRMIHTDWMVLVTSLASGIFMKRSLLQKHLLFVLRACVLAIIAVVHLGTFFV